MKSFSFAAYQVLEELKSHGIRLSLADETHLVIEGVLTDDLRKRILANKDGLLQLVKAGEADWVTTEEFQVELVWIQDDIWALQTWAGDQTRWRMWHVRTLSPSRPFDQEELAVIC